MVDPATSALLHLRPAEFTAAGAASLGPTAAALSAVREMRISQISHVISLAKSEAPSPARERDELRKTACDLLLRLQLVMLQETAHRQAKGLPPPPCPLSLQGGSGAADELDAARQMRELLQHAACWCPKPLAVSDAALPRLGLELRLGSRSNVRARARVSLLDPKPTLDPSPTR